MHQGTCRESLIDSPESEKTTLSLSPEGAVNAAVPPFDTAAHPALLRHPTKLFVETTTHCNLRCEACVKQADGNGIVDADMTLETFMSLVPAFSRLESLVLNGIGEPLLHPELEEFVRIAKAHMPAAGWVGFQSNGALLTRERAVSLLSAGVDRICLSVDSLSCDSFKRFREGGEVGEVERALALLAEAKAALGRPGFQAGIEFVLRRDNFRELPQALEWAADRGATFAIASHLLTYDESLLSQVAYDYNSDEALAFFEVWKRKADAAGIEMHRYLDIYFSFRYLHTPEEKRILEFVRGMLQEATRRGVFLHVKNLLAKDDVLNEEMKRTFEGAREVAQRRGLVLKLPEVVPKAERRCDFVEGGSAMVSWDGSVHPCYYLWHKYTCYFNNRTYVKHVDAKSFGNAATETITDIWNGEEFLRFRQEVLGYDFAFCTNCNVVPCEFIYNETFTNDCHTSTVPCGDCFWCMGMFNCLQ